MTTITFKNGEQFTVKAVWSKTSSFQGADRKTLEIRFVNEENLFEKLKSVYSNAETLAEIYVKETNEEGEVLASSYHTDYIGDKMVCDKCGGELFVREDDNHEAVKERISVYNAQTKPLVDFYSEQNKLVTVDGEGTGAEVFKQVMKVIK